MYEEEDTVVVLTVLCGVVVVLITITHIDTTPRPHSTLSPALGSNVVLTGGERERWLQLVEPVHLSGHHWAVVAWRCKDKSQCWERGQADWSDQVKVM